MECVDGMEMPKSVSQLLLGKSLKEHVDQMKCMEIRDDDLLVCAFAKSGNFVILCCLFEIVPTEKHPNDTTKLVNVQLNEKICR